MSTVFSPTILPAPPVFPRLLPLPPKTQPKPVPPEKVAHYGRFRARRDLQKEMDDLSEEENEIEELNTQIQQRGFTYMVPLGRTYTVQEEKNDADDDGESEDSASERSGAPSVGEDEGENGSTQDLDASMEDLDEEGESEDEEMEDGEDYEEQPSDM